MRWKSYLSGLLRRGRELAADLTHPPGPRDDPGGPRPLPAKAEYGRLARVVLTDEVSRTLFGEYAAHRASARGAEETGWLLFGLRTADEAVVLATFPAAADRDAGEAHVWITGPAHLLASRVVRQDDRRLALLGVVHTHPGSLRHPSRGDLEGDRDWVPQLRGGEGVFGIGTADAADEPPGPPVSSTPKPHAQCLGGLRFSWYALAAGDKKYRPLPVGLCIGPDLGAPLRPVWGAVEAHAERLERVARQQARARFAVADGPALSVTVGLADPGSAVRVVVAGDGKEVRYYYEAGGEAFRVDLPDAPPDQGLYLLLAELAGRG